MRTDPVKKTNAFDWEAPQVIKYKQRAAIIFAFIVVFYFFFKVIFNL